MFVLTTISDVIQLSPTDFNKQSAHALKDNIHKKYANNVLQNVGLCICFWDFLSVSDGQIIGGDAHVHVNVTFRIIVFRPFKGEVIQAVIAEIIASGIRLTIDFFHDIWVPKSLLFEGSDSTSEEVFSWSNPTNKYYYEVGEQVRFRVESEVWHDITPSKPRQLDAKTVTTSPLEAKVPYTIIASMASDGMGPIFWWDDDPDAVEEDATAGGTE